MKQINKDILLEFIDFVVTLIIVYFIQLFIDISLEVYSQENLKIFVNGNQVYKLKFIEFISKINILWIYTIYKLITSTRKIIKNNITN